MRARRPLPSRTMRPYSRGSCGSNERTVAATPSLRCVSTSASECRARRPSQRLQCLCSCAGGWLGRQDSNLGSRDQNPLPYHLATPQGVNGISLTTVREDQEERNGCEDPRDDQHEQAHQV